MLPWRKARRDTPLRACLAAAAIALGLHGCIIDRSAVAPPEGERDAAPPSLDAGLDVVDAWSATPLDAWSATPLDAWSATPVDAARTSDDAWVAPVDTGAPIDAGMGRSPDAWSACGATSDLERCNARDDDCDGRVDEAACGATVGPVTLTCDAFVLGTHVYQLCRAGVPVPWDVARMVCEAAPPYRLVTIDDTIENAAISGYLAGQRAWIGLNDLSVEGTFEWAGAPSDFRSWASMEPTSERGSSGAREDCVSIAGVLWRDEPCGVAALPPGTDVAIFVCEAEISR